MALKQLKMGFLSLRLLRAIVTLSFTSLIDLLIALRSANRRLMRYRTADCVPDDRSVIRRFQYEISSELNA